MNQPLVCSRCQTIYEDEPARFRCNCGGVLDMQTHPVFEARMTKGGPASLWRYREALPPCGEAVTKGEGFTPLLAISFDGRMVHIKQEQLMPTGSFKDRGAAVMVTHLRDLGVQRVVEDSSGNAGCAVAAYAAHAGIACDIYVPEDTSPAKTAQIEAYGATLHRIPGTRDQTAAAALSAAESGLVYASHVWNPWFLQGTKTFAYEVAEQLGWTVPDTLVLPAGNGTLVLAAAIGFGELLRAGIVGHVPRIVAVQAEACAPLARAFEAGASEPIPVEVAPTDAEGIAIGAPARGAQILAVVRDSGGQFICVSEREIAGALRECCSRGWFIEPTSAATIAGLRRYLVAAPAEEVIVSAFTGHGLKAAEKVNRMLREIR